MINSGGQGPKTPGVDEGHAESMSPEGEIHVADPAIPEEYNLVENDPSLGESGQDEESQEGLSPADSGEQAEGLSEELNRVKAQAEASENNYLRALAEMQNLRKRTSREVKQARDYAVEEFARDLLSVADNMDRAMAAVTTTEDPSIQALVDGVKMIQIGMSNVFKKHGLTRIETQNVPFDPNLHQAVLQVENQQVEPGFVVQELQSGFLLNGRLLRAAMVGVAKAS